MSSPLEPEASFTCVFAPQVTLNHGMPVPAVLLANKSDQASCQQPKMDSFCRENGFVGWFETSAKVGNRSRDFENRIVSLCDKPRGGTMWKVGSVAFSGRWDIPGRGGDGVATSPSFFYLRLQENTNIEEGVRCLVEHIRSNEEVTERGGGSLVLSGKAETAKEHLACSSCAK